MPDLLDVTLRDGGYVNDHAWTVDVASQIVRTMADAGIDHVEVGYLRDYHRPDRPAASCPPAYLEHLSCQCGRTRPAVMVRPGEASVGRIAELPRLGVRTVRVLAPDGDVGRAAPYLHAARKAGLRPMANLTRVSEADAVTVADGVRRCIAAGAGVVYLADSNGGMFPEQVRQHVRAAVSAAADRARIGFHPHDNLSMAFVNACAAVDAGAEFVDASLAGIGKGGGNLRIDLIAAYWKIRHRSHLRIDPLLRHASIVSAEVRAVAAAGPDSLLSGLLNLNLDGLRALHAELTRSGCDDLLSSASEQPR